jgi:hypothetical protein
MAGQWRGHTATENTVVSNWEIFVAALVLSLLTLLVAPAMWGSYATPMELLRKLRDWKKWRDQPDE